MSFYITYNSAIIAYTLIIPDMIVQFIVNY